VQSASLKYEKSVFAYTERLLRCQLRNESKYRSRYVDTDTVEKPNCIVTSTAMVIKSKVIFDCAVRSATRCFKFNDGDESFFRISTFHIDQNFSLQFSPSSHFLIRNYPLSLIPQSTSPTPNRHSSDKHPYFSTHRLLSVVLL